MARSKYADEGIKVPLGVLKPSIDQYWLRTLYRSGKTNFSLDRILMHKEYLLINR